jgi:hypothetical protein
LQMQSMRPRPRSRHCLRSGCSRSMFFCSGWGIGCATAMPRRARPTWLRTSRLRQPPLQPHRRHRIRETGCAGHVLWCRAGGSRCVRMRRRPPRGPPHSASHRRSFSVRASVLASPMHTSPCLARGSGAGSPAARQVDTEVPSHPSCWRARTPGSPQPVPHARR